MSTGAEPRQTHHARILGEIRDRITAGQWPPGHQLPFETVLADEFGVSRMTMNKALAQLTREGYLVRQRKLGTFVARPVMQAAVMEIADIEAEIAAIGETPRFELRERQQRMPTSDEIALTRGDAHPVLALQGVHFAGDQPFCHERRIISLQAAPTAADVDFRHSAPGAWLLREIPWTSAEHRIRAIGAPAEVARALRLAQGTPCLQVTRRTEIAGEWVTVVILTYPGDRHQLVAQFGPAEVAPPGDPG